MPNWGGVPATPTVISKDNLRYVFAFSGQAKFSRPVKIQHHHKPRLTAWLDSGANESMLKESPAIAKKVWISNTTIGTAHEGDQISATHVGDLELQTKTGYNLSRSFGKVIFSEHLRDNLISVGRICDGTQWYSTAVGRRSTPILD